MLRTLISRYGVAAAPLLLSCTGYRITGYRIGEASTGLA